MVSMSYVWTWVLLLAARWISAFRRRRKKVIPEYSTRNAHALLRGFLSGSRWK